MCGKPAVAGHNGETSGIWIFQRLEGLCVTCAAPLCMDGFLHGEEEMFGKSRQREAERTKINEEENQHAES